MGPGFTKCIDLLETTKVIDSYAESLLINMVSGPQVGWEGDG